MRSTGTWYEEIRRGEAESTPVAVAALPSARMTVEGWDWETVERRCLRTNASATNSVVAPLSRRMMAGRPWMVPRNLSRRLEGEVTWWISWCGGHAQREQGGGEG